MTSVARGGQLAQWKTHAWWHSVELETNGFS